MRIALILVGFYWSISVTSFAQDHVFVFLNSKTDKAEISETESEDLQKSHMANIKRMVAEGQMIVAGPFEGGGGIFILKTGDVNEARIWLSSDPAIKAERWNIEILPISFLKGGACLATEPFEMVVYNFARVNYVNDIANYKVGNSTSNLWSNFKEEAGILAVGTFPQSDGGIIVYNETVKTPLVDNDLKEQIKLDHKQLWVAKGSFCEKP